jgi:hypothetical protein
MTNTNRLASHKRTLKHGAIITTATASILMLTAVVASGKPADVGAKPTKQEILTVLRLVSLDSKEYKCNKEIIRKESNYNPSAKNGSHYGLAQGRTQYHGISNTFEPDMAMDVKHYLIMLSIIGTNETIPSNC